MSIEYHVKCRDAHQLLADAHNEELERKAPVQTKYGAKDFDRLAWSVKEGTKGNYEQTSKEVNQNNEIFQALQEILATHKGFWQNSSHKFWFHQGNKDIVDRRKK